jgi:uncharacterized protein
MIIISDTSPITNLIQIEQIHLIRAIFTQIIIPASVYDELCVIKTQRDILKNADWIRVLPAKDTDLVKTLEDELDKGEAEAIALAIEYHADFLIIDEIKGRIIAESKGIKIVGLLGILIKAKEKGLVAMVKPLMNQLQVLGFRINPTLYEHILKIVNEV